LYSSDYGYHAGYHIYRGHFVATGNETSLTLYTQQGRAYGQSIWLNETYIGSWTGVNLDDISNVTYQLPKLTAGKAYVFTILLDHMGLEENWVVGQDLMKTPRGILNYTMSNREQSAITWKLTGNLGGEDYVDHVRGPLNEGGLYVERQGWHQPEPPSKKWQTGKSLSDGISKPGVGFFVTSFELNLPEGWDVPLFFSFNNGTLAKLSYRVQLYVNGYQFGKYSSNIGPQATFPVPEGILNYHGTNWVGISLWALEEDGAHIDGFALEHETPIKTSMRSVELVNAPAYKPRPQSY
jgi:beta-galactosidase